MRWLMRVARSRWGGRVAGWVFAKMSFALPIKRILETERVLAFEHPTPTYEVHILLVPKAQIEGVEQISSQDGALLGEVFAVVRQLVEKLDLQEYRVIVNGGANQEVKQLHFHLVSGEMAEKAIS